MTHVFPSFKVTLNSLNGLLDARGGAVYGVDTGAHIFEQEFEWLMHLWLGLGCQRRSLQL